MTRAPHQRIADLPTLVLGPFRDRSDNEWESGPPRKWTPAQIVEHLALGLTLSAETFQKRRSHAPMCRRRRTAAEDVARFFIPGLRWFPPGRKASERTTASPHISRSGEEAHFLPCLALWDQG